jgi:hypothetical protein
MGQDTRTAMLARLSEYAYAPGKSPPPGFELVNGMSFASGLSAVALRDRASGEVIISYRGTDNLANVASWPGIAGSEAPRIKSALAGVLNNLSAHPNLPADPTVDFGQRLGDKFVKTGEATFAQYVTEARDFARRTEGLVREGSSTAKVSYTGHSLGGALAQIEASRSGAPAATFNAPGMSEFVRRTIDGADTTQIVNFRREGDLVSEVGTHAGRVVTHPAAGGVPIVDFLTEHSQRRYVEDLESGLRPLGPPKDGYLTKPVILDEATQRLFNPPPADTLGGMSTAAAGTGLAVGKVGATTASVALGGAAMAAGTAGAAGLGGPGTATAAAQEATERERDAEGSGEAAAGAASQSGAARAQSDEQASQSDTLSQQGQTSAASAQGSASGAEGQASSARQAASDAAAKAGSAGQARADAVQQTQSAAEAAQAAAESEQSAQERGTHAAERLTAATDAARDAEQGHQAASQSASVATQMASAASESRSEAERARDEALQARQECESLRSAVESLIAQIERLQQDAQSERQAANQAREETLRAQDETRRLRDDVEGLRSSSVDAEREATARASQSSHAEREASSAASRAASYV